MKRAVRDAIASTFDYIIVGAGSTGCVLANRLSQNPNCRVLLIEAGSRDHSSAIHQPDGLFSLWGGDLDWQHSTEPQSGLNGRSILLSQGKVLGGSSSINAMIYTHGHRRDFDFAQSGSALGYGTDWDFNGAQQERGTGLYQVTVNAEGKRCSAAVAFLNPILYRSNLTILTDTEVTQIVIENDRAVGIRPKSQLRWDANSKLQ
jgi:choline dehydrogenase